MFSMQKSCLIIYGIAGSPQENWFPWLKDSLAEKGWNVAVPELPETDHPNVEIWNRELLRIAKDFNQESVIIGHSMGVPAGLNLLQSADVKIGKFIGVAPVNPMQPFEEHRKNYPGLDWDAVENFADIKFNWEKIKEAARELIFYYSNNDPYVPEKSVDFYKGHLSDAQFLLRPGSGHFNKSAEYTEFPELLEKILS